MRKHWKKCHAVAEEIVGGLSSSASSDDDQGEGVILSPSSQDEVAEYDWTEEWYPLYLTKNIPDDAPLGLTVFDKQVVLYRDGNGEIRCFEDRCAHR